MQKLGKSSAHSFKNSGYSLRLRHKRGAFMGERSAVRPRSGKSVRQSDPGLRRPTPPSTAGRKPAARPPASISPPGIIKVAEMPGTARTAQHKTGRGAGWNPAVQTRREAPGSSHRPAQTSSDLPSCLDDSQITALIHFFQTLDRWDKEAHGPQVM